MTTTHSDYKGSTGKEDKEEGTNKVCHKVSDRFTKSFGEVVSTLMGRD